MINEKALTFWLPMNQSTAKETDYAVDVLHVFSGKIFNFQGYQSIKVLTKHFRIAAIASCVYVCHPG